MAKKRKARATKPTATPKKRRPSSKRRERTATPIVATAAGPIVVGPPPIVRPLDHVGNFFDAERPKRAVIRPDDLVALRLELRGLSISAGKPPRLRKTASGKAQLIVHFPPQAITEQTFFETRPPGTTNPPRPDGKPDKPDPPGGTETPSGPPVRARISGESRLAFDVPDGFNIPYTLESVLSAIQDLELLVTANARPPASPRRPILVADIFTSQIAKLPAVQRASLTSFAARSLRIAAVQGDTSTFALRQAAGGPGVRAHIATVPGVSPLVPRTGPKPALPSAQQTSIELPWRLIISPHSAERWRHATEPVTSPEGRIELWHSRLVAPKSDGTFVEPPEPDAQRTTRAVWALTGEGSTKAMQSQFPVAADLPVPPSVPVPFRTPLEDFDRFQIVHLSSNFSVSNYAPQPVGANLLMLSTLGGWLDSRGSWDPPGLSVEEWVHRASMGRDHYV